MGVDPKTAKDPAGTTLQALHNGAYVHGDRRPGQRRLRGRPARLRDRPDVPGGRYPPSTDPAQGGGSHVVLALPPGHSGPTYKARELGIDNLKDVP